jgi:hypothetical protein
MKLTRSLILLLKSYCEASYEADFFKYSLHLYFGIIIYSDACGVNQDLAPSSALEWYIIPPLHP